MARKINVSLIDDLDGSAAESTVRFGLDGAHYEIELNAAHAMELRTTLEHYAQAARKVTGAPGQPAPSRRSPFAHGPSASELREWARAQGIEVRPRGRIPAEVVARFQSSMGR
jgi:hypothetical protein